MRIPYFQVDAFAEVPFRGNPAGVCPLSDSWPSERLLQQIAEENNLAETAFFLGSRGAYHLRWFTPRAEVDLCGHATLASAWVVFQILEPGCSCVCFTTRSGELTVTKELDGRLCMDFPALPIQACQPPAGLVGALGSSPFRASNSTGPATTNTAPIPQACYRSQFDWLLVYGSQAEVAAFQPNMQALAQFDTRGVIVSSLADPCDSPQADFVSRFFAPAVGVPEDPVTGSAHCVLAPYWADKLGKADLLARQISPRGGLIWCQHRHPRVNLLGHAVCVIEGTILVPEFA